MAAPKGNKFAKGNKGGEGKKSEYNPRFASVAAKMCAMGATDADLAEAFGFSVQTINNWKSTHQDFALALKRKNTADEKVERSLFERATGYALPDTHISNFQGAITATPLIKHYPPDTTACIFWLKNRRPAEWRDKSDVKLNHPAEIRIVIGGNVDNPKDDETDSDED